MRKLRVLDVVVPLMLLAIVVLGCSLRLRDPMSSPVVGAEDPYTHLVFTKEALARGYFGDSQWLGTSMYPPGLHALGGVLASDSGTPLYTWILWSPLAFGALSIVGMFALGNRLSGPAAGLVAALLVAVMPEHVFRTELYFPTALDLAVLPALLYAFVVAADPAATREHRIGGTVLFAALAASLAFAHPWAVPLFLAPAAAWAALRTVRARLPFREGVRRLTPAAVLAVTATAFAVSSRWDHTDSGFASFFAHLGPLAILAKLPLPGPVLFPVFLAVFALAAAPAVLLAAALGAVRAPRLLRVALAALCAVGALLVVPMLGAHPGPGINYRNMLGPAALELSLVGLAVAFLAPTAVGDMGLALSAVLYPLTAINLFDSAFWPQRTVVYLALGAALLASGIAAALVQGILAWKPLRAPRRAAWVAPAATIAAVLLVAGAVNAAPAKPYSWYRLYTNDEFAAIQATSAMVDKDPSAHVMVYSWQPGLFLKAAGNPDQVRYCPKCYQDAGERAKALAEHGGSTWYVVVDAYTDKDAAKGKADEGWVGGDLVESAGHWRVYRLGGS